MLVVGIFLKYVVYIVINNRDIVLESDFVVMVSVSILEVMVRRVVRSMS